MADKIRFGIIGCGGIARRHINNLLEYEDSDIVALNDPSPQSLQRHVEAHPELGELPHFDDYREMLDKVEMDAVLINSPHTLHYDQIMDSLNKGLHVHTEKPMVCTVAHAKSVIQKAEEKGLVLLIGYQRHYEPEYKFIKSHIESGGIGKVTAIAALQGQDWLRGTANTWRQQMSLSGGGQLNDSGSHLLDILLWTTGLAVDQVMAYMDNRGSEVDINSATTIRFTNGAVGTITVVGDCPTWWEDFTVWGDEGAVFCRNGQVTVIERGKEPYKPENLPERSNPDRNFLDVIQGKDVNHTPALCGLRGIELCEAAWKSAEQGRPVSVSELG